MEYPYEQLVIYVSYLEKVWKNVEDNPKRALEIGFGSSIADMKFLTKRRFSVHGLEVSENAVKNSLKKSEKESINLESITMFRR